MPSFFKGNFAFVDMFSPIASKCIETQIVHFEEMIKFDFKIFTFLKICEDAPIDPDMSSRFLSGTGFKNSRRKGTRNAPGFVISVQINYIISYELDKSRKYSGTDRHVNEKAFLCIMIVYYDDSQRCWRHTRV